VRSRSACWTLALLTFLGGALLIASSSVSARTAALSPSRLAARDPGLRLSETTVVVTGDGATVVAVRHRANFIAALGSNETVIGGDRGDVLAARGTNVTIRAGNGNAVVFAGPRGTLIGGRGRDLLVATKANTIVIVRGSGSEVVVSGAHDRVMCSSRAHDVLVYRGPSDTVSRSCRAAGARVRPVRMLASARLAAHAGTDAARAHAAAVTGDGSNDRPYTAGCDPGPGADCTVSAFPQRTLDGPWANEYVPAYSCPGSDPYLLRKRYGPPFTNWGPGVQIQEDDGANPIGVSISGQRLLKAPLANVFGATLTGYPNSSATNWLWGGSHWYKVVLHCSANKCHGTDLVGRPRGCGGGEADKPAAVASSARPPSHGLAAQLAARDPGAPLGGNTIVVAGAGARVFGVPRRANFIIALGANERISGGAKNDQLGAIGANVTISGGRGDDLIYGGPGGRLIGGPGRDRLARLTAAAQIEGNGSSATPYQAPCTTVQKDSCTISSFPSRELDGLWANEFVPAYQCPDDHQYLYFKNYAPAGTTIPHGVEVHQDSIGISITATVRPKGADLIGRTYGTATGFPNSSATSWAFGKHSYRVILHCTSFANLAATIF
jgi:Ca2+-binding RTX toxin-like protein